MRDFPECVILLSVWPIDPDFLRMLTDRPKLGRLMADHTQEYDIFRFSRILKARFGVWVAMTK
jgi:hypothetical protein